jgi:TonB family protein
MLKKIFISLLVLSNLAALNAQVTPYYEKVEKELDFIFKYEAKKLDLEKDQPAELMLTINRNGEVRRAEVLTSSGNSDFDKHCINTILTTESLPHLANTAHSWVTTTMKYSCK